eukprot:c2948_g1_i1.p1 GENE.c2948_g1_i1~~c2948_g1_i1.p1  ORF type:complete len:498 (-),score=90.91 c2948_g1_i1:70-1524(-)
MGSLVLWLMFSSFALTQAYIYSYNNELLRLGHLEYRRVGLYTPQDSPASGPPGNGESYIAANVTLTREVQNGEIGILQIIVTHSSTFGYIGFTDPQGTRHFCCTQSLLEQEVPGCTNTRLGMAIISPDAGDKIQIHDVVWDSESEQKVNHKFSVYESGRYYLLFSSCLNSTGDARMSGQIVWMNPYGYLPGELYQFIPLFGYLAIGYLVLGLIWGVLCVIHRHDLLHLQHYVSVVIMLGLLETMTWYVDYRNFNLTGSRAIGPVIAGVLLSNVKRTLSRLLVLIVCMGYGVMKPSLGSDQRNKVIALGVVYFVFSSVYDVMSSYSQMTFIMQHIRAFFLFPVAALDSLFFLWILQEISSNIQQLTTRHQEAKLRVYQRFWQILVTTAIFSVTWAAYQVFVTMGSNEDARWNTLWAFEGMWHVIYFAVLVAVAFLWRPSPHATAYAFSEQLTTDGDEDDGIELAARSKHMEPAFTIEDDDDDDQH